MRRGLCVAAVCAVGLALAGCGARTTIATNVTQTSARLNAVGHTDDSPAHFFFRYADDQNDLPTAAAQRTPVRHVPDHVPQDGSNIPFGENVTGLSPGRLYWFEVCGGDAAVIPDLCGGVRNFFTQPTVDQDYVVGSFRYGGEFGLQVDIQAASGPQGQNADGWLTNNLRNMGLASEGRVTCLAVNGGNAAVGVVGTAYTTPGQQNPRAYSAVWTLRSSDHTFRDTEQSPPNCAGASFANQAPTDDWALGIHDAN